VSNSQRQLAQQNKALSVILMVGSWLPEVVERNGLLTTPPTLQFSFPITLTSTIFSTRENIIPFIPANFVSFVIMSLVFGGLGVSIYAFQEDQYWKWQVVVETARRVFLAAKMEYERLKTLPLHKEESMGSPTSRIRQDVEDRASQVRPIPLSSCDHRARPDFKDRHGQDQASPSSVCSLVQQLPKPCPVYFPRRTRTEDRHGQDQAPPSSVCNLVQQLPKPRPVYFQRRTRTNGPEKGSE
jgi:hypothetical protein